MKKRIPAAVLAAVVMIGLAGCRGAASESSSSAASSASAASTSEESTASSSSTSSSAKDEEAIYESLYDPILDLPLVKEGYALSDCIKLGEYKKLGLTRKQAEVTDEQVEAEIEAVLPLEEVTDPNATVQQGDTIHLSFEGTIDGVPFDGGTSEDFELVIGSGNFIDGFEDGMVGMKVDEERDLALRFPDSYHNADLAGQDCNFHVKVLSISRTAEPSDAWAQEYTEGECKTLAEYREHVRADLLESTQLQLDTELKNEIWTKVKENSTFLALPEKYVQDGEASFRDYHTSTAESYEMTMEDYLKNSDVSQYEFDLMAQLSSRQYAQDRLLADAVAEAEGMTEESEEYQSELAYYSNYFGMSVEEMFEEYGEEAVQYSVLISAVQTRLLTYVS